jgi:hypothetical protein
LEDDNENKEDEAKEVENMMMAQINENTKDLKR